jgi:hypothetical protein
MVSVKARNEREMDYKNHQIEVSVSVVSGGWMPEVLVTYSEKGKNMLVSCRIDQTFATSDEAEQAGFEYAKKWVDESKP